MYRHNKNNSTKPDESENPPYKPSNDQNNKKTLLYHIGEIHPYI